MEFELTDVAQSVELAYGMGVKTTLRASRLTAAPAMIDDSQLSFSLPSVLRKKVTAVFDGGRLSSDSGVMLLALADRRRRVADRLAALIADHRDPAHITHTVAGTAQLTQAEQDHLRRIQDHSFVEFMDVVFASGRRSLESLRIAHATTDQIVYQAPSRLLKFAFGRT